MEKLPTPIEIIETILTKLKKSDLDQADQERLTQIASQLTDFNIEVEGRATQAAVKS